MIIIPVGLLFIGDFLPCGKKYIIEICTSSNIRSEIIWVLGGLKHFGFVLDITLNQNFNFTALLKSNWKQTIIKFEVYDKFRSIEVWWSSIWQSLCHQFGCNNIFS